MSKIVATALAKGQDFTFIPAIPLTEDIKWLYQVNDNPCKNNTTNSIREGVVHFLWNSTRETPFTKLQALKGLRENRAITLLPADRGNVTVIRHTHSTIKKK